jgi:hypothetical protein
MTEEVIIGANRAVTGSRAVAESSVDVGRDVAETALDTGNRATGAALGMGKSAVNFYIQASLRAIDLGSDAIKKIGDQVPKMSRDAKERLIGIDEPSLGDRPSDNNN